MDHSSQTEGLPDPEERALRSPEDLSSAVMRLTLRAQSTGHPDRKIATFAVCSGGVVATFRRKKFLECRAMYKGSLLLYSTHVAISSR